MTQKELQGALAGKPIVQINFSTIDENDLTLASIGLATGELLNIDGEVKLSHPEAEEELAAFYDALKNIPPSGIVTFKAKYLSQGLIERTIAAKAKELNANGYGRRNSQRQDYLTYRFDLPE